MSDSDNNSPHEMSDDPNETQVMITYAGSDDEYDEIDDYQDFDDEGGLGSHPPRPRRVLVNRWSALLAAVLLAAAGFYAGVRVEKSKVGTTSSSATGSGFAALASRFTGATGRGGTSAASGSGATGSAATGSAAGGAGGFAGPFGGAAGAGGGTSGTISSIDGDTLYIDETGGNTVKVNLADTTTLKKTVSVSRKSLYPGDTVAVAGSAGSNGTIKATSVTDSGASASSTSSTASTGSSSSSTSGSSALSSLFGG